MKPQFLYSPELVEAEWCKVGPHIDRVVSEAAHGEFDIADLYRLSLAGRMLPFYVVDDNGEVFLAGLLEMVRYPAMTTINVVALGGERMMEGAAVAWPPIVEFARHLGAKAIEASCSKAMARLLRSALGFEPAYENVRFAL